MSNASIYSLKKILKLFDHIKTFHAIILYIYVGSHQVANGDDWDIHHNFYREIHTPEHIQWLEHLQELYLNASRLLPEDYSCAHQLIAHLVLLGLRDYFECKFDDQRSAPVYTHRTTDIDRQADLTEFLREVISPKKPISLRQLLKWKLNSMLTHFKMHSTFVIEDVQEIQQFNTLCRVYQSPETVGQYELWQNIIEAHPELKAELERAYQKDRLTADAQLLQLINDKQLQTIYVLFKRCKYDYTTKQIIIKKLDDVDLEPYRAIIEYYAFLERFMLQSMVSFGGGRPVGYFLPSFPYDEYLYKQYSFYHQFESYFRDTDSDSFTFAFSSAQFNFKQRSYLDYFKRPYKTSNQIQLDTLPLLQRSCQTLRLSPSTQIHCSIDYFTRHIESLADTDIQQYLIMNLFESNLLMDALQEDPQFLARVDKLIDRGIAFFSKDGKFSQQSIFFIQLSFLVKRYALQLDPQKYYEPLRALQYQIKSYLSLANQSTDIQSSLNRYHLLTIMARYESGFDNNDHHDDLLKEAVIAHCLLTILNNHHDNDTAVKQHQLLRARIALKRWLGTYQDQTEFFKALIPAVIQENFKVNIDNMHIEGQYPWWICSDATTRAVQYRINLEQGLIFQKENEYAYCAVPEEIKHHALLSLIGLQDQLYCSVSSDQQTYIFDEAKVRLIKRRGQYGSKWLCLQKAWQINGRWVWYELQPLTAEQRETHKEGYKYRYRYRENKVAQENISEQGAVLNSSLPTILYDQDKHAWVALDNPQEILVTHQLQPFVRKVAQGKIEKLTTQGDVTSQVLAQFQNTKVFHHVAQFEDPKFILIFEDPQTHTYEIHLPRYQLILKQAPGRDEFYLKDSKWRLVKTPKKIGTRVASLHFVDGKNEQLLLPIQRFILSNESFVVGARYPLKQDIAGAIQSSIYAQYKKQNPYKSLPAQHSGSEAYVSYSLKQNQPIANTPAESLFLCYVYMCSHQFEKAWETLDDCRNRLHGLQGTTQEVQYLSWIVNAVPYLLQAEDAAPVSDTLKPVATRLKAMRLLTDFCLKGKKFTWPRNIFDENTMNGYYHAHEIKETQFFIKNFCNDLTKVYENYIAVRKHDSQFNLNEDACRSLLNFYYQFDPNPKPGALSYEKMYLDLKLLQKEYQTLKLRKIAGEPLSPKDEKRLAVLENDLAEVSSGMAVRTELELVPINLAVSKKIPTPVLSPNGPVHTYDWDQLL